MQPNFDPILSRPSKPEPWSLYTAFRQITAPPAGEQLSGGDVSSWQGEMDWNAYFDNGMNYTVIRAMINGYPDVQFERNAQILSDQKRPFLVYGATGYPTLSNSIPYARALADIIKGMPYLGVWWDAEVSGNLTPYEMSKHISEVLGELTVLLPNTVLEIYTRQTFWDSSVQVGNWNKYPLAAARYNTSLTSPWSDGRFVFRDWSDWRYWQDSQWWDGKKFGAKSTYIDHLLFNGNEQNFHEVYSAEEVPPPVPEINTWNFEVLTDQLNYRSAPIVSSATWRGTIGKGKIITASRTENPTYNDFWLKFKINNETYYCALTYKGTQYCRQV